MMSLQCKEYMKLFILNLLKAIYFATYAHKEQIRKSGEAYIVHPIQVAELKLIQTRLRLGFFMMSSKILGLVLMILNTNLEKDVAFRWRCYKVRKIKHNLMRSNKQKNHRKMLLAMATTCVIMVKLADRLHNLRTLKFINLKATHDCRGDTWNLCTARTSSRMNKN